MKSSRIFLQLRRVRHPVLPRDHSELNLIAFWGWTAARAAQLQKLLDPNAASPVAPCSSMQIQAGPCCVTSLRQNAKALALRQQGGHASRKILQSSRGSLLRCRALPIDNQRVMDFLTAEGKSFDDLELDDDYYRFGTYRVSAVWATSSLRSWTRLRYH